MSSFYAIAAYSPQDNALSKQSDKLYETKTKLLKIRSDDTLKWKTQNRNTQSTEDRKHDSYATSRENALQIPSDENQTPTIQSSSFTFEVLDGIVHLLLVTEH